MENTFQMSLHSFTWLILNLFLSPISFGIKLTKALNPITFVEQLEMKDVPYAIVVDKLMYLVTNIWPYLAYAIGYCVKFMANHGPLHWAIIKCIFRYLKLSIF
jgi:hypothetical protein